MHFLDPQEWNNLDELTQRFEELDDERVKDLHEMLRPYFLRRVKADVLKLPPKVRGINTNVQILESRELATCRMKSLYRSPWLPYRKRFTGLC